MSWLPQLESLELRQLLSSSLVADFNGVFPTNAVAIDGISYFTADEGLHGYELWKSDGTIAGTTLVKDLISGKADSQITFAGELDGALLFFSRLDDGTLSLWRSDGTSNGTSKLADIGHQDSRAILLNAILNDKLVFITHGAETDPRVRLWASDGASAGTTVIKQLYEGEDYNTVTTWFELPGRIVFRTAGDALISTDATAEGTTDLRQKIAPGGSDSTNSYFSVQLDDALYVPALAGRNHVLWKTDGTVT